MSYALQTLWHERSRYASGVLAVTFSAVLIALQCGLLLGLFKVSSLPIDITTADLWVGSKAVPAVDLGKPIPSWYMGRVDGVPGVTSVEPFIANWANLTRPAGGTELCFLLGCNLDYGSAGAATVLSREQLVALTIPDSIIVDEAEVKRLGLDRPGNRPKINGKEVTLVGTAHGIKGITGAWVLCSLYTARHLLEVQLPPDHVTYLLAKCQSPARAQAVAHDLQERYGEDMAAYTAEEFSTGSRRYWLLKTKAGIALGYAALLGLVIGAVITAQTLYSATMANAREFALLLALGIPRKRMTRMVFTQALWVGAIGIALAYPACQMLRYGARRAGADVDLRWEVLVGAAVLTLGMTIVSGVVALRGVRRIDPIALLR